MPLFSATSLGFALLLPAVSGSRVPKPSHKVTTRGLTEAASLENKHLSANVNEGAERTRPGAAQAVHQTLTAVGQLPVASVHRPSSHRTGDEGAKSEESVRRLVSSLVESSSNSLSKEQCWVKDGERMGCEAKGQCQCSFLEQCYPKFVLGPEGGESRNMENIGICGTAMPVLIFLSGALFVFLLSCVVMARMYFQWRESQMAEPVEGIDRPKSLLLPSSPSPGFPSADKAEGTVQTPGVAWPEAEDVGN